MSSPGDARSPGVLAGAMRSSGGGVQAEVGSGGVCAELQGALGVGEGQAPDGGRAPQQREAVCLRAATACERCCGVDGHGTRLAHDAPSPARECRIAGSCARACRGRARSTRPQTRRPVSSGQHSAQSPPPVPLVSERKRQTDRDRQTQTDRQRQTETVTQRERERERQSARARTRLHRQQRARSAAETSTLSPHAQNSTLTDTASTITQTLAATDHALPQTTAPHSLARVNSLHTLTLTRSPP